VALGAVVGILGLAPIVAVSGRACADTVVDLELNGTGAIPWSIANIQPGDQGIQSVGLRNAGSSEGQITIWISDITESDHGGDGASLDDYLLFNISSSRLVACLDLPARLHQFPQASADSCLKIDHLAPGENVTLAWAWEFQETGLPQNDAQGDSLSFTINYAMEEIGSTGTGSTGDEGDRVGPKMKWLKIKVLGRTTTTRISLDGTLAQSVTATDASGDISLQFEAWTTITGAGSEPPGMIEMKKSQETPEAPAGAEIIGTVYEIVGYADSTDPWPVFFDPPVILTLHYDAGAPASENSSIIIGSYSAGDGWTDLDSGASTAGKIGASIAQTSTFAVLATAEPGPAPDPTPPLETAGPVPAEPDVPTPGPDAALPEPGSPETTPGPFKSPALFELGGLVIEPARVAPGEPVTIAVFIRNSGELQGTYGLELGIGGKTEQSQEITLAGGGSSRVVFATARDLPGTYAVTLGDMAGEFMVLAPALSDRGSGVPWGVLSITGAAAGLVVYFVLIKFKVITAGIKPFLHK
jgi:hypothetical protein